VAIAEAVREGGIEAIEVTMTVPGALDVIRHLSARYPGGEVLIGAGTVLDSETCRSVILAGAEYVVSPCLSLETIRTCNRYRKSYRFRGRSRCCQGFPRKRVGARFCQSCSWSSSSRKNDPHRRRKS